MGLRLYIPKNLKPYKNKKCYISHCRSKKIHELSYRDKVVYVCSRHFARAYKNIDK